MTKVLVSLEADLLARIDRAAQRQGETRSGFIARVCADHVGARARLAQIRRATNQLDELFATHLIPGDTTAEIRAERDAR